MPRVLSEAASDAAKCGVTLRTSTRTMTYSAFLKEFDGAIQRTASCLQQALDIKLSRRKFSAVCWQIIELRAMMRFKNSKHCDGVPVDGCTEMGVLAGCSKRGAPGLIGRIATVKSRHPVQVNFVSVN
jgi:hypothetical protein